MACTSIDVPSLVVSSLSFLVSAAAFGFVLYDRRPVLAVHGREGAWIVWEDNILRPGEKLMRGILEVYNRSARPNSIKSYAYRAKTRDGKSVELFSELYTVEEKIDGKVVSSRVHNQTPLVISPYTGVEVSFACFVPIEILAKTIEIVVTISDVYEKSYAAAIVSRG